MAPLLDPQIWAALVTLTALEIVLGIDNLVFVALLANRLPRRRQAAGRRLGLGLALLARLALLASVAWVAGLTTPIFAALGHAFSWRDVILIVGGLFLVYSGTREIHGHIESDSADAVARPASGFAGVVAEIVMIDIVFSLDNVITAVGMVRELWIMAVAIIGAMVVMVAAATPVAEFINRHPTVKVLALSFLLLIGTMLVADGFGFYVPRGYIYAAIGFSIGVEAINQMAGRRRREAAARRTNAAPGSPPLG